jgi:hypothetical protein
MLPRALAIDLPKGSRTLIAVVTVIEQHVDCVHQR